MLTSMNWLSRIATLLLLCVIGQCLWAQALPASISGVVLDEKDQAVAGENLLIGIGL